MSKNIPIVIDVESDGPCPGMYSMVCFGAVIVEPGLNRTFYAKTRPVSNLFISEALAVSGFSREDHVTFDDPLKVMAEFNRWLHNNKSDPEDTYSLWSDNNLYDGMFMNYYFYTYVGHNPLGWSARRIGDLYAGYKKYAFAKWKHLRQTPHTHNPVDDAKGNAEVLLLLSREIKGLV